MSSVRIELDFDTSHFAAGDRIGGQVVWDLARPIERLELTLFWRTSGKGTVDTQIVRHATLAAAGATGSAPFSLTAPESPYSFSGRLITLAWSLEALVEPGGLVARQDIVIAPGGEEVLLPSAG